MNGIKLISTGSAVPKKVVTNDDLAKIVDTNDEWISTRTGIRSRRYCTDGESHTSLCLAAAGRHWSGAASPPAKSASAWWPQSPRIFFPPPPPACSKRSWAFRRIPYALI